MLDGRTQLCIMVSLNFSQQEDDFREFGDPKHLRVIKASCMTACLPISVGMKAYTVMRKKTQECRMEE